MNKLSATTAASEFFNNPMAWMEVIFSNIGDGVIVADECGNVIYVNAIVKKILEKDDKDIVNENIDDFVQQIRIKVNEKNECDSDNNFEITLNGRYDNKACINIFTREVKNSDGIVIGKAAIIPDISECDKAHQIIHKMAHYDSLTGLGNRALINERLDNILLEAKEAENKAAVAFIDLDNFKLINDTMGHDVGDIILRKVSEIIEGCIEHKDFAGRLGGDEFIILMPEIDNISQAIVKINRLIEEVNIPVAIDDKEFYISASAGISIYPNHGEDSKTLIKNADTAMYIAKGSGKNSFKLFNSEMNSEISKKLEMINDLQNTIKNNEFVLNYQPQIDIRTNSMIGMESVSQLEFLKKEKCSVAQGFLFSKPLSKFEFVELINKVKID